MAALGRLLQIIGWLWVLVGFIGPRVDLDAFGLESIGVLPGLVLIFIARAFRARARAEEEQESGEARPQPRPIRTDTGAERRQAPSTPAPARSEPSPPAARQEPSRPVPPRRDPSQPTERKPQPKVEPPPPDETDLLERIALAGRGAAEGLSADDLMDELKSLKRDDDERKPISSAEMIAQARKRWDRPGR